MPFSYSAGLSGGGSAGGPGSDTTAARLTDPRFYGIERVDLRAKYGAYMDGSLHPLSGLGLAAAQAKYPNIGLTSSTDLTTFSTDTAALLQAEYDLRMGAGGIIGLADGARVMLTQQLALQSAFKVWLHGGRDTLINTAGCGTTPALKLTGARTGKNTLPLMDIEVTSGTAGGPSSSGGGIPHTLFTPNAAAFAIDNCIGTEFKRVAWSGYDSPFVWGDEVYNIQFENWSAGSNNIGVNWDPTGNDSMERVQFNNGSASNNNYGVRWNAAYSNGISQGGSVFFNNDSLDYNIVRSLEYTGKGQSNTSCGNSFHLNGCHVETSGACSGNALSRILAVGAYFMSECEIYELDTTSPAWAVELGDNSSGFAFNNRFNSNLMAIFGSSTGATKVVEARGNVYQDINTRPRILVDSNGTRLQLDGMPETALIFDPTVPTIDLGYYGKEILVDYYGGDGLFTLPAREVAPYPTGYSFRVTNVGQHTVTFAIQTGTGLTSKLTSLQPGTPAPTKLAPGAMAVVRLHDSPTQEWIIGGQLTT